MKQIIIFLLLIIAALIGYGKYQQYKRFNSVEAKYETDKRIDLNHHNQEMVISYFDAVHNLDLYTSIQWNANEIDVRKPVNDDVQSELAVAKYAKKLARVKYYEAQLVKSSELKEDGLSNSDIKRLEISGNTLEDFQKTRKIAQVKSMFNPSSTLRLGEKSAFVFEVQKLLVKKGYEIPVDGVYMNITSEALYAFEEKNNLFPDGKLDVLTLNMLLK